MGFHDLKLLWVQSPRFQQNPVGNADLANVVQGSGLEYAVDHRIGKLVSKARMPTQMTGQGQYIVLGTKQVVAGFVVAGFRQRGQRHHGHLLADAQLFQVTGQLFGAPRHLLFKMVVALVQKFPRGSQHQMGAHTG